MNMEPESQAVLREFNRRLRLALREAPNHVRVEAALEVESHVLDVLSRPGPKEAEAELVSRVLSGFGSPEAYARAILSQMPDGAAVTVRGGLREVGLAVGDLLRGMGRLGLALARRSTALAVTGARLLWHGASLAVSRARGPAARAVRWSRINGAAAAYGLRRFTRSLRARGGESASALGRSSVRAATALGHGLDAAARGAGALAHRLVQGVTWLAGGLASLGSWVLRAAGIALLAGLALAVLGIAAFTALAPDVTGWFVQQSQVALADILAGLRYQTIGSVDIATRSQFARTGTDVLVVALPLGLLLTGLLVYLVWSLRRRRSTAAENQ